ncbi:MAG: hypothetical protein JWR65_2915, partial [Massilia sp.]|nr:hypothetical protein [Massilia sp.]
MHFSAHTICLSLEIVLPASAQTQTAPAALPSVTVSAKRGEVGDY